MFSAEPLFSEMIVLYLFLGGAAGGTFFIMSLWSLIFHRKDQVHENRLKKAFKSLQIGCYTLGFVLLVISVLFLLWDLGVPERALYIFIRPQASVLTFGSFALALLLLVGFVLATVNILDLTVVGGKARKVLEVCCSALSLAVIIYTGVFLASLKSVPFWNNGALVCLFAFSSLSAGVSIVLLIDYFIKDQTILLRAVKPLQRVHLVFLIAQALSLGAFTALAFTNPAAQKSIMLLLEPDMLATALIGAVGMGIIIPFVLESYSLKVKELRFIPVSDFICLIGGLCLRFVIVSCGIH